MLNSHSFYQEVTHTGFSSHLLNKADRVTVSARGQEVQFRLQGGEMAIDKQVVFSREVNLGRR